MQNTRRPSFLFHRKKKKWGQQGSLVWTELSIFLVTPIRSGKRALSGSTDRWSCDVPPRRVARVCLPITSTSGWETFPMPRIYILSICCVHRCHRENPHSTPPQLASLRCSFSRRSQAASCTQFNTGLRKKSGGGKKLACLAPVYAHRPPPFPCVRVACIRALRVSGAASLLLLWRSRNSRRWPRARRVFL